MSRAQRANHATLTKLDFEMIHEIAAENVGWSEDAAARRSFHLWSSDIEYTICTPRLKRLVALGFAETVRAPGYTHANHGYVTLTDKGKRANA